MFRFIEVDPGRVVVMRAPGANRGSETEQAIRGRVAVRLEGRMRSLRSASGLLSLLPLSV